MDRSAGLSTWEQVIEQLAARQEFKEERFFYTIEGFVDVIRDRPLKARANAYHLRPNREYDLRIYHFHPAQGDPGSVMGVKTAHPSLTFTTNPQVLLDSRYDLKRMRLRTSAPTSKEPGVLTVRRQVTEQATWEWEFDLPLQVRGVFWRKLAFGLIIGAFLAVSPIVSAYSNPNLSADSRLVITAVSAVSSVLAGVIAAFGLRRSL